MLRTFQIPSYSDMYFITYLQFSFSFGNRSYASDIRIYMYGLRSIRLGGAQWLSGRVLDSRPRGRGFEPHRSHCVVSLSKNINPSLELVQSRKTRPFITEILLMRRKESNQSNKQTIRFDQIKKVSLCMTRNYHNHTL